jgi:hypothetical protein
MIDRCESPLVDVELKILQDSSRLTTLPHREVEKRLVLAGVRMFAIDPRQNRLWQDLVNTERTTCPLPACRNVLHFCGQNADRPSSPFKPSLAYYVSKQKLMCYDKAS